MSSKSFFKKLKNTILSTNIGSNADITNFTGPKSTQKFKKYEHYSDKEIKNLKFNNLVIQNEINSHVKFINCDIQKLTLENCDISVLSFENCNIGSFTENNCIRYSCSFTKCKINNLKLYKYTRFLKCKIDRILYIKDASFSKCVIDEIIKFENISLHQTIIENIKFPRGTIRDFEKSVIKTGNIKDILKFLKCYFHTRNEKLRQQCMAVDAQHHSNPKKFDEWAKGGLCPYADYKNKRLIRFEESRKLWKPRLKTMKVNISQLFENLIRDNNSLIIQEKEDP